MPARPNARNKGSVSQRQIQPEQQGGGHRTSPPLSPPAQLPTPLPEEIPYLPAISSSSVMIEALRDIQAEETPAQLIDFNTPPPAHALLPSPSFLLGSTSSSPSPELEHSTLNVEEDDGEGLENTYTQAHAYPATDTESGLQTHGFTSPPFKEAQLPGDSPPPLPIMARGARRRMFDDDEAEARDQEDMDGGMGTSRIIGEGHTRAPMLVRHAYATSPTSPTSSASRASARPYPTHTRSTSAGSGYIPSPASTLESLTRTIRGYVPSSSTAVPSPPLVSRAQAGRFSTGSTGVVQQPQPHYAERRDTVTQHPRLHTIKTSQQEYERDYEHAGTQDDSTRADYYGYGYGYGGASGTSAYPASPVEMAEMSPAEFTRHPEQRYAAASGTGAGSGSGLAQAMRRGSEAGLTPVSPSPVTSTVAEGQSASTGRGGGGRGVSVVGRGKGVGRGGMAATETDTVVWSGWGVLEDRNALMIAYPAGFQIWDCGDLNAVSEVLNLNFDSGDWRLVLGDAAGAGSAGGGGKEHETRVIEAAILPTASRPAKERGGDKFGGERPLLGILMELSGFDDREGASETIFVLYSLRRHSLVKRVTLPGLSSSFVANEHFIVISTTTPPTLHIFSAASFRLLHTISSASLEAFAPIPPSSSQGISHSASLSISNALSSITPSHSISNANTNTNSNYFNQGLSVLSPTQNDSISNTNSNSGSRSPHPAHPHPVFALSHRLLAYASPSPVGSPPLYGQSSTKASRRLSNSSTASGPSTGNAISSLSSSPFGLNLGAVGAGLGGLSKLAPGGGGVTQADLGNAAMRVGESVFSGMKFLGGKAMEAARNRGGGGGNGALGGGGGSGSANLAGRFVSRSAPDTDPPAVAGTGGALSPAAFRERRLSSTSSASTSKWDGTPSSANSSSPLHPSHLMAAHTRQGNSTDHYITVVDLECLLSGGEECGAAPPSPTPTVVDVIKVSRTQPVAAIRFSRDGLKLGMVPRDGHSIKIFHLKPTPSVLYSHSMEGALERKLHGGTTASHVYTLRRGRTSVAVEGVEWTSDARWFAIGTRNRTIHVFPTNPYGGAADVQSHVEGKVKNVEVVQHPLTELTPLARLRSAKRPALEVVPVPLAFVFVSQPPTHPFPLPVPTASPPLATSLLSSARSTPQAPPTFEDILVFDPMDGILSLRRLILNKKPANEQGLGITASVQALGVTSVSFPGMGASGRLLSGSPSTPGGGFAGRAGGLSKQVDVSSFELVAKEEVVSTWDLVRKSDWPEVFKPVAAAVVMERTSSAGDWLAEAELSTSSNSRDVLPRSIYLSHQFTFQTLGEDYHALIRRFQFDFTGSKIDVRKEVEVNAYSSSSQAHSAAFIEGFSSPSDIRRAPSSSFDEPIASAISGSFDSSNIPSILPMYPNGIPGAGQKSFRNSIPILTMAGLGDGVTEGIGRLRREMHKVRSPRLDPRLDTAVGGSVPLEFDEHDEDFLVQGSPQRHHSSTSRDASRDGVSADSASSISISTPANSSTAHLMDGEDVVGPVDEEIWKGWDSQDKLAIEEAEKFNEFTGDGFLEGVEAVSTTISPRATSAAVPIPGGGKQKRGRQ